MRLNKYISNCGHCSRRVADKLISSSRVKVNNKIINKLGVKINPKKDRVTINGKLILTCDQKLYYKVYKPKGFISTTKDPYAKKIVTELVDEKQRLFLVGRLDKDSEGLMILTNDGELTYKLTHPKNQHKKVYIVSIYQKNNISKSALQKILKRFKKGVKIDSKTAKFAKSKIIAIQKNTAKLKITLLQGIKRQIREMFKLYKYNVSSLKRIQIAKLKLGNLKPAESEKISIDQIV